MKMIWGALCEKNKWKRTASIGDEVIDVEKRHVDKILPIGDSTDPSTYI